MKELKKIVVWLFVLPCFLLPAACDSIDEDLSDCGKDYRLDYRLQLITNMTTELETVLDAEADAPMATALYSHLKDIFSDYAHDVSLSFYNTTADSALSHHESEIMDANQTTYTIYLPVKKYMHLALANIVDEVAVKHQGNNHCPESFLEQMKGDTIVSHNTGLFTARLPMEVVENQDQTFYVPLYMANCAAAVVIDTTGCQVKSMKAYITDMADGFYLRDSVYTFNSNPIIRTEEVHAASGKQACYVGVCFPSRNVMTKATATQQSEGSIWKMKLYVTLPDGTTTENLLYLHEPLLAGNLKIIKLRLKQKGEAESVTADVGVSVTLDWKKGGEYNPVL